MNQDTKVIFGFFALTFVAFLVLMFLGLATNLDKKRAEPPHYYPGPECAWVCVNDPIVTPTPKEQQ